MFPDMPCMKKVYKDKKAPVHWSEARKKNYSRPADKLVINRWSTGRCVPPSVYIGFCLFVLLESRSGDVFSMPSRVRGTLVSWANCSVGVQSWPAPPRRPAVRPDPTRTWYVRVLDSTNRIPNPDMQRAERFGAAQNGAAGRGGTGGD